MGHPSTGRRSLTQRELDRIWSLPASKEDGNDPDPAPATQQGAKVPFEGAGFQGRVPES